MPPRYKNSLNFRNFIAQRIKINFYFYFYKIYFIKNKKYKLFFYFLKIKFFVTNYFFFDLVESKGYMPLCQTTDLLAKAMYRRLGAICQNRKSLIMIINYYIFHYKTNNKCCRRNPTR